MLKIKWISELDATTRFNLGITGNISEYLNHVFVDFKKAFNTVWYAAV